MQGCNFNCATCHNPHTIGQCDSCGECLRVCEPKALSLVDGKIAFEPSVCTQCDACLDVCPISANPMFRSYSIPEILDLLHEHAGFLSGITISGGEATMQLPFIRGLFTAMSEDSGLCHLTRFIDSNGHLGPAAWQSVLEVTDGVLLDIKAFDLDLHVQLTGRSNSRSLASARLLHEKGKLHELRFLMVPEATDRDREIDSLIEFVRSLDGPVRLKLNAFRTHGVRGAAARWPAMSKERVEAAAERLTHAGFGPVELPALW